MGLIRALSRTTAVAVNKLLAPLDLRLTRRHDWSNVANFIPFERTIEAARKEGISVGDYIDNVMSGTPGVTQDTIDKMTSLGVFSEPLRTIVEIGPGSGRYLEKTIKASRPARYEIYETARPWAQYLVQNYDVVLQPTDGYSLSSTADASADLVQAHKVFSGIPFMATCCCWQEMARVIRPGGWAVFDVITERCLGGNAMEVWAKSGIRNASYPAVMPRESALKFFSGAGFRLLGSFIVPLAPGTTELMIFRR
jgi:SAM-dependent methyltransferase